MAAYPSTRWSQVVAAGGAGAEARGALAWLCERYWDCLVAHARRRGFTRDAEDLTQDFLLEIIGGAMLERADRERGRFRTFLLGCLDHHLMHARDRQRALKRGGGGQVEPLDEQQHAGAQAAHERSFDRDWAQLVVRRTKDRVAADEAPARWLQLAPFLSANGDAAAYTAAGAALGLTEGAVKVAVHRLRERFRAALREEVAQTLDEADERLIDGEIALLLAALSDRA